MLNHNYKKSFVKAEYLKKAQRANPRLYDVGCYNDNLALMLAPESDETIRLAQESRSKLSDLIKPFDYKNLNNLYDLFVPQREKSSEQRYFSERPHCVLLEDLTAFCFKTSLRFASRPHCVLLQDIHCVLLEDLTAFCLKTSLRFASRPHCVLLQAITAFCFNITAFCSRPPLRFA
ncbi:hypothetical protein Tco_0604007 [Tanacetum coccineum]